MNELEFKRLQETELEILDVFAAFCEKHKLRYSLAYGTMLGAVRHKGFIPWDDDIDIIMPREDYERLLSLWDVPGFVVQNKRINSEYGQSFSKIRKDHTSFIQYEWEKTVSYHTGIFVDIFPGDRVASSVLGRMMQKAACTLYLLYTREFTSEGPTRFAESILLWLPRKMRLNALQRLERYIGHWNSCDNNSYFFPASIPEIPRIFPAELFDNLTRIRFEDREYMCARDTDKILSISYGDYMELPPEEERVLKHHPLVVDFEKNWDEIKNLDAKETQW